MLGPALCRYLSDNAIHAPTAIQEAAIPQVISGADVFMVSPTGTGKTLAYLLPLLNDIDLAGGRLQAAVLAPTHELAAQIYRQAADICAYLGRDDGAALIIGGASLERQLERVRKRPVIAVATPGRLLELAELKKLTMHFVRTVVVDEADRMLDEKNRDLTLDVIKRTLKDRRLVFCGATADEKTLGRARLASPALSVVSACAGRARRVPDAIAHWVFVCRYKEKVETLIKLVRAADVKKGVVFLNGQDGLELLCRRLNFHGIAADYLHGGSLKNSRRLSLEALSSGRIALLLSSDLAARGIDIKDINCIINLDVPENADAYLHRAGRTGRMGRAGLSVIIATPGELNQVRRISGALGIDIARKTLKFGRVCDYQGE